MVPLIHRLFVDRHKAGFFFFFLFVVGLVDLDKGSPLALLNKSLIFVVAVMIFSCLPCSTAFVIMGGVDNEDK